MCAVALVIGVAYDGEVSCYDNIVLFSPLFSHMIIQTHKQCAGAYLGGYHVFVILHLVYRDRRNNWLYKGKSLQLAWHSIDMNVHVYIILTLCLFL